MGKCRHKKLVLVYGYVYELIPDQEPYKSGEEIDMDKIDLTYDPIHLVGHWCEKCRELVDVEVDDV